MRTYKPTLAFLFRSCWTVSVKRSGFVFTSWIWKHGETRAFAFGGIDALHKAGFQQPPAAEYTLVYDGELTCPVGQDERDILERIFARYNQAFPPDYRGRSIAPSDVLELYDESERRYFYCDMAGFPQVKFSPALAKKA